jgi:hypothetical protein
MSMERTISITCPGCGNSSDFVIWQSINTVMNPDMKQAVRDCSAFAFTCPHCKQTRNVDYGFLYHQMDDKIMIHYATSDEEAEEVEKMYASGHKIDEMLVDLRAENYMIRIVRSHNQLLEKLAIIDAGLDDRLVEIYKVFLLANAQKEKPELGNAEILMLTDDGKHYLQFLSDHKSIGYAEISMDTYRLLEDEFGESLPERGKQGPLVDRRWALEFMKLAKD